MHYVISGTTSGTGVRVVERLMAKVGVENLTCLVRATSDVAPLQRLGLKLHVGDVTDEASMRQVLRPDVTYIDMTHPKHYHKSLQAVMDAGIERAYFVTTTGIYSKYNRYSDIYKINEAKIRESGITYTILRPSMIYGSLRDKNMNRLIRFLNRYPAFPLFGAGRSLMQPVFVDDLADGIVAAIGDVRTENQEYNLAGPQGIPYRVIVETIVRTLQRRVMLLHVGLPLAASLVKVAQHLPGFPVNEEQVLRLLEDKVFDISKAEAELNYRPRAFEDGIRVEVEEMRAAGVIA
jgi:nucleoside-diphosphate-sugar epimerase